MEKCRHKVKDIKWEIHIRGVCGKCGVVVAEYTAEDLPKKEQTGFKFRTLSEFMHNVEPDKIHFKGA